MLTLKTFLIASGLDVAPEKIKLVRHVDHSSKSLEAMIKAGEFEFYQSEQLASKRPFHGCEVIVAFLATAGGGCAFHGIYKVHRETRKPGGRVEFLRETAGTLLHSPEIMACDSSAVGVVLVIDELSRLRKINPALFLELGVDGVE